MSAPRDGTNTYTWDAEGRLVYASDSGTGSWHREIYNPLGQRVAESMPDGSYTRTFLYPRDLAGHWTGVVDVRPSISWTGWDMATSEQAGVVLQYCCGYTYLLHQAGSAEVSGVSSPLRVLGEGEF